MGELEGLQKLGLPAHSMVGGCEHARDTPHVPSRGGHGHVVSQQQLRELQLRLMQQPEDWLSSHDIRQLLLAAQACCNDDVKASDESGSADAAAGLGLVSDAAGLGLTRVTSATPSHCLDNSITRGALEKALLDG